MGENTSVKGLLQLFVDDVANTIDVGDIEIREISTTVEETPMGETRWHCKIVCSGWIKEESC